MFFWVFLCRHSSAVIRWSSTDVLRTIGAPSVQGAILKSIFVAATAGTPTPTGAILTTRRCRHVNFRGLQPYLSELFHASLDKCRDGYIPNMKYKKDGTCQLRSCHSFTYFCDRLSELMMERLQAYLSIITQNSRCPRK